LSGPVEQKNNRRIMSTKPIPTFSPESQRSPALLSETSVRARTSEMAKGFCGGPWLRVKELVVG
jgi:hypothetical protein